MRLVFLLTLLIASLRLEPVHADAICGEPMMIFYANGVKNTRLDAVDSQMAVADAVLGRLSETEIRPSRVSFSLAYNFSEGLVLDLLEAYEQKKYEDLTEFWKWYFDLGIAPQWFQDEVAEGLSRFRASLRAAPNLDEQIASYRAVLDQNGSVLTVAHSQGNLFSNMALELISQQSDVGLKRSKDSDRLKLVSVATPADHVALDGPYLTLTSDGVINHLIPGSSAGLNSPLSANFTNSQPKPGSFDHEFLKYYLFGESSGEKIIGFVIDGLKEFDKRGSPKARQISATCMDWWNSITEIDRTDPDKCVMRCVVAPFDMGTFTCNGHCEYLCKCHVPR